MSLTLRRAKMFREILIRSIILISFDLFGCDGSFREVDY